jgi:hypothetical protein
LAVNITRAPAAASGQYLAASMRELETFQQAGEIVRVPTVSEYQGDGDRPGVLTGQKIAWG